MELIRNQTIGIRIKLVGLFLVLLLAALVARLHHVQVKRHDELFMKARDQYTGKTQVRGKRGEIYDYDGNLLVGNIPYCSVVAAPYECGDEAKCREISIILGKYLKLPAREIYAELTKKTRTKKMPDGSEKEVPRHYALIAKEVPLPLAERLRELLHHAKVKGIYFEENTKRYYPKNELLANILGFTSIDRSEITAVLGIEKFFNKVITPTDTEFQYERARDGVPLAMNQLDVNVRDGTNIYLTIREPLQEIVEEELDKMMEKWRPRAGYAIMIDPYSGNVMAIAQRPTFNPNDRSSMNPDAWRSRLTEDIFEPGSTMKPVAIAGAIDSGVVTPGDRFDCENGMWFYGGKTLKDSHPMKILTVAEIVQKSSNIGTAKIALKMGERRLYDTLRSFGFGEPTGIPMKPETRGIFRPLKKWDTLSITRFPIGQGIACSPVQLARAYCALANGGNLVSLRLVDRVENPDTGVTVKYPSQKARKIYRNASTHQKIINMMKLVTQEGGTATKAAIPGYHVAGKTGTSQKFVDGAYSHSMYFATFVGFVPADNPRFVLLVTADEPKDAHYGGTIGGPIFKGIAERALRYLDIKPNVPVTEKKKTHN